MKKKDILVINLRGMLLQNTTRQRAAELLEQKKAKTIQEQPLVIQLLTPTGEDGMQRIMVKPKRSYSVKETAKLLHYSLATIYRRIKAEKIPAQRKEHNWFIPGDWLQAQINTEGVVEEWKKKLSSIS